MPAIYFKIRAYDRFSEMVYAFFSSVIKYDFKFEYDNLDIENAPKVTA